MLLLSVVSAALAGIGSSWGGINSYYLWSCNSTVRAEALDAIRASGLRVVRVFLLGTDGGGAVPACADSPTPDVEPVGGSRGPCPPASAHGSARTVGPGDLRRCGAAAA